ncbi:hypothetical protein V8C34DRAFT_287326 [Trichoderma compactum]
MTQSETPPQRQSHPTSSNLRHSGMSWFCSPMLQVASSDSSPNSLTAQHSSLQTQPLSVSLCLSPCPPTPFSSSLFPFLLRLVLFYVLKYGVRYSPEPANTRKSVLGTCTCTCTRTGNLEVLSPMTTMMYSYLYRHP